jgi:hypothetical protein
MFSLQSGAPSFSPVKIQYIKLQLGLRIFEVLTSVRTTSLSDVRISKCYQLHNNILTSRTSRLFASGYDCFPCQNHDIRSVPGGTDNILGGHSLGHSKQNCICTITVLFTHVAVATRWPSLYNCSARMPSSRVVTCPFCCLFLPTHAPSVTGRHVILKTLPIIASGGRTETVFKVWAWDSLQGLTGLAPTREVSPKKSLDHTLLVKIIDSFYFNRTTRTTLMHTIMLRLRDYMTASSGARPLNTFEWRHNSGTFFSQILAGPSTSFYRQTENVLAVSFVRLGWVTNTHTEYKSPLIRKWY